MAKRASQPPEHIPKQALVCLIQQGSKAPTTSVELTFAQDDVGEAEVKRWCRVLRKALGCRGAVKEGAMVFQGNQRKRVIKMLQDRGVKRVRKG